jgi:integrase
METHDLMGGRLHVYKRENSRYWQCSTYLAGKNRRMTTKEDSLAHAKEIAEDWYLELRGKARAGQLKSGPTFKHAADRFLLEYEALTVGQRNPRYVQSQKDRLRLYLVPFFGRKVLSEITPGLVQEYRIARVTNSRRGKPPSRSTMHQEIVALRQVLKCATRYGWLEALPDISPPYKTSPKIVHRGWFSPDEYRKLYEATRRRAQHPKKERFVWECEQLHDYVLFLANTGLRPDEAKRLEYRDVRIITDEATRETILEIEVRGKRGIGYCKSMTGAVLPFKRLKKRNNPQPTDKLFPNNPRQLLNAVLGEEGLKVDRDGNQRTAYSLRHTYVCFRLMEGADIYQIAKNCRTSVEMIEKYYATHIQNTLDAAAINVRKRTVGRDAEKRRRTEADAR